MNEFIRRIAQKLDFRQRAYQTTFPGSIGEMVMADLAKYCRAYEADIDDISKDNLMRMSGRRDVFFRIARHLKLSPTELEQVYRSALLSGAAQLHQQGGEQ